MDVQRSLAAIVFTDVVGYSARVSADENKVLRLLSEDLTAMRAICARHDGHLLKTMGDGALMVFGSAVQAVEGALEMQTAFARSGAPELDRLVHRIGVHVGDVLLSEDDAQGDGVNIAARLQQGAPPGKIWISGTVYEIIKGRVEVVAVPRGSKQFKNIPNPVPVFELHQGVGSRAWNLWRLPKASPVMATSILAAALMSSAGLIYLASLHPAQQIMEVFRPAPSTDKGEKSVAKPEPRTAPPAIASRERVRSFAPSPLTNSVRSIAPVFQPIQTRPQTKTAMDQTASKSLPLAKPPGNPQNSGALQVSQNEDATLPLMAMQPPAVDSAASGLTSPKTIDPQELKKHYAFGRYSKWLQSQPDAMTGIGRLRVSEWRALAQLRETMTAALATHSEASPLLVTMDGPTGSGIYKLWETEAKAGKGQPILHMVAADNWPSIVHLGELTPQQLDAIIVAVGQSSFPADPDSQEKRAFQRRKSMFEREYGIAGG